MSQLKGSQVGRANSLLLSHFVLYRPSIDWMQLTHNGEDNLLHLAYQFIQEVSEHRILIKSGPGNWSLSASGTTHKATYRISP